MLEENLENTFAADPYRADGGLRQALPRRPLYAKIENPAGQRVERLFIGDQEVTPNSVYEVAYVTAQGVAKKYGRARRDLDIRAVEALQRYIAVRGVVTVDAPQSIIAV